MKTRKIPVCYFPINTKVTANHASAELGRSGIHPTPQLINKTIEEIVAARGAVKAWARHQLQQMMFVEATRQGLTHGPRKAKVKSMKDIMAAFREDGSEAQLQQIWEVAFGTFDRNPGWAKKLADEFMSDRGWMYITENLPANKKKYCVEQEISLIKVELVKGLNKAVALTHGKTVRISRFKEEITEETKYEKRKKSVFQVKYIALRVSPILILPYLLIRTLTTVILVCNIPCGVRLPCPCVMSPRL